MHDAFGVSEVEASARLDCDADGLLKWKSVLWCVLDDALDIAAAHKLRDHVWLA